MTSAAEAQREYRKRNPEAAKQASERHRAKTVAARVVARQHPEAWRDAYVAECERVGIEPDAPVGRPAGSSDPSTDAVADLLP